MAKPFTTAPPILMRWAGCSHGLAVVTWRNYCLSVFGASLRDLARFGEMVRNNGRYNGLQILPPSVVTDIQQGASREDFAKAGYQLLPGWSYRDMWWVSHNAHGAFMARGVHGQALYIDPTAEMVIARFASNPVAGNAANDPTSLPAYEAVAKHLIENAKR
jgi:CubicO group peptidase (beta-lactamase class C family)